MHSQTITVVSVVTTTDDLGDATTTETEREVAGVLFEPQQATERTDPRSPGVVTPAKFYLPIALTLDVDDAIRDASGVLWQVQGGAMVWQNQTEVAVRKVG